MKTKKENKSCIQQKDPEFGISLNLRKHVSDNVAHYARALGRSVEEAKTLSVLLAA